ncbi:MAG: hypothetical protein O7E52_10160 [Candidatus Poribacteria bacterium]|nr:hypothetical protein [Candidatus Poribacteria bacterium]
MSALALISEFSERGIKVRPNGSDVVVSPKDALTPDLVERIKVEKPTLIRELEKLQKEAGKDWDEIANDPAQLKAFAELSMIVEMREKGSCPAHYTSTTDCRHCGPVPIWKGCPPQVNGCPWCLNRHKGLPMPSTRRESSA